jgi:hypothetical protein
MSTRISLRICSRPKSNQSIGSEASSRSGFRACLKARGVLAHSTKIDIGGLRYLPYDHNRILRELVMPS